MKRSQVIIAAAIAMIAAPAIAAAVGGYTDGYMGSGGAATKSDRTLSSTGDLRLAQATPTPALPGGASSVQETYGSWTINCRQQPAGRVCSMSQQQSDPQSGQRQLAIEFSTVAGDRANGVLLLPFGLALADGVQLAVGSANPVRLPISTCLPVGCIARLSLEQASVQALRQASEARVTGKSDGGGEVRFSVSLDGFSRASARLSELLR